MSPNLSNTALVMLQTLELSIVVKATAARPLALVAARLAARERASVRHVLLASAFAALLALPLVAVSTPRGPSTYPSRARPSLPDAPSTSQLAAPSNLAATEPLARGHGSGAGGEVRGQPPRSCGWRG